MTTMISARGRRIGGTIAAGLVVGLLPFSASAASAAPVSQTAAPAGAASAATVRTAPAQWLGQSRYEYYSGGLTMHYFKGQSMALSDPSGDGLRCFSGSWVAPGMWTGHARDSYGYRVHATVTRSTNGKTLRVRAYGETTRYHRAKAKAAVRAWGSLKRAKRAADLCFGS
jgi:hypothetical protein